MRIFVTGATGLVGRRLVVQLQARGEEVVALTRSPAAAGRSLSGCRIVAGNPAEAGPWLDELSACDAVVHLAGEPILAHRWRESFKQRLRDSRVNSTRLIAQALSRQPRMGDGSPRVLVCASAIGFYGSRGDEELDEVSSPGTGFLPQLCQAWEQAANPARDVGMRVSHVRVGMVLDPTGGALPKLARPFRWFVGGPVSSGKQWVSWIHHEDMTGILLCALDNPVASGPINATAPEPVKNWGFCKTLAEVLNRPCWLTVPRFALRLLLGEAATIIVDGQRVYPRRATEFGYSFRYPDLDGALRDLLRRQTE